jgi:hypothetical protein
MSSLPNMLACQQWLFHPMVMRLPEGIDVEESGLTLDEEIEIQPGEMPYRVLGPLAGLVALAFDDGLRTLWLPLTAIPWTDTGASRARRHSEAVASTTVLKKR